MDAIIPGTNLNAPTLTQERLKELLHYDPDTGTWTWLQRVGKACAGDSAGYMHGSNAARELQVDGEKYRAAALAFLYMTGQFPSRFIGRVDGDIHNDIWANLYRSEKQQFIARMWTPDRVATVRRMWKDNSASQIAAVLGPEFTRCSVIGKVRRLGLSGIVKTTVRPRAAQSPRPNRQRTYTPRLRTVMPTPSAISKLDFGPTDLECSSDGPDMPRIDFADIKHDSCRWPLGDELPYLYCGKPCDVTATHRYCPYHALIAYGRAPSPKISIGERMRRRRQAASLFRGAL